MKLLVYLLKTFSCWYVGHSVINSQLQIIVVTSQSLTLFSLNCNVYVRQIRGYIIGASTIPLTKWDFSKGVHNKWTTLQTNIAMKIFPKFASIEKVLIKTISFTA